MNQNNLIICYKKIIIINRKIKHRNLQRFLKNLNKKKVNALVFKVNINNN